MPERIRFGYDGTIRIMDLEGHIEDETWYFPALGFLAPFVIMPVPPAPVSKEIEAIIEDDRKHGKEDKIAFVMITPRWALRLAMEGKLTPEIADKAVETSAAVLVQIELAGKMRNVVIVPEETQAKLGIGLCATYDIDGNVV